MKAGGRFKHRHMNLIGFLIVEPAIEDLYPPTAISSNKSDPVTASIHSILLAWVMK